MTKNQLNIKNKWKKTTRQKKPHLNVIDGKQTKKADEKIQNKKNCTRESRKFKKEENKPTNQPCV